MNDRGQKQQVLKYILSRHWFPQVELDVTSYLTIGKKTLNITDVDVLACIPDDFRGHRKLLVDCKTKKAESPINRAMWLKGLIERFDGDLGMSVMRTTIAPDHRYTAAQMGVTLLAENEFSDFAACTSSRIDDSVGSLGDLDVWDRYFEIPRRFAKLKSAVEFSRSGFWMTSSDAAACRKTLATLLEVRAELDPAKAEHVALVGDVVSLFMYALSAIVTDIFAGYMRPKTEADLSKALQVLLYGGRDAYDHLHRLKKIIVKLKGADESSAELGLPEWDSFVQLVRQTLDAPFEVNKAPLLGREVAYSYLIGSQDLTYARSLAKASRQGARFAVLGLDYVCKACRLPKEFADILSSMLLDAQEPESLG